MKKREDKTKKEEKPGKEKPKRGKPKLGFKMPKIRKKKESESPLSVFGKA